MRWALVSEHDVDDAVTSRVTSARVVDGEPHDAVKSRGGRVRRVDRDPSSAAKGEHAASTPGEIRC